MPPIRIAILGSGIFARDSHLPAFKALGDTFEVVAIYSRNAQTASSLASMLPTSAQIYTELEPLLACSDIDAVDIIMPIAVQPEMVETSLRAGKHVISEKPVAPDVATGRQLLHAANDLIAQSGKVWMVAENMRFEPVFQAASDVIQRGELGKPIYLTWATSFAVNPQNKYYHTAWRRDNSFPGGFILDGGVHNMAAIRTVMGEVESVSAVVTQMHEDLPPADTLSAVFQFTSGAIGNWTQTYATEAPFGNTSMQILGERGAMLVNTKQLEVNVAGKHTSQAFDVNAIQAELAAFARMIHGEPVHSTPAHALQDVALIQAILESARTGCAVKPERVV